MRKTSARYCEMHDRRVRRTGTVEGNVINPRMPKTLSPVGANIRALRTAKRMSVKTLTSIAGISHVTLYSISVRGSGLLSTIEAIAKALDVEVWQLMKPRDQG
jgi:DNA-binding Xre family transcriptional regulator